MIVYFCEINLCLIYKFHAYKIAYTRSLYVFESIRWLVGPLVKYQIERFLHYSPCSGLRWGCPCSYERRLLGIRFKGTGALIGFQYLHPV